MQYPSRKRVDLWAESHRESFPGPEMSWSLPGCMWIFTDWDPHTPFLLWFLPFLNGTPVTAILCTSHHSYCGAGEDSWEVPWTARRSNQSILKEPWILIGRTDAEVPLLWPPDAKSWLFGKGPDAGENWGQEEKGATEDEIGLSTQWTWVWANSGSQWRAGKPGMLQSMGLQRVGHDLATVQQQQQQRRSQGQRKRPWEAAAGLV